jgi:hypothetical protein
MFVLNRPALITAGQILNQQCQAAAVEAIKLSTAPKAKPPAAPSTQHLITAAISQLAAASTALGTSYAGEPVGTGEHERTHFANRLAGAVADIFHLAASLDIDLGAAIAGQLHDSATA